MNLFGRHVLAGAAGAAAAGAAAVLLAWAAEAVVALLRPSSMSRISVPGRSNTTGWLQLISTRTGRGVGTRQNTR